MWLQLAPDVEPAGPSWMIRLHMSPNPDEQRHMRREARRAVLPTPSEYNGLQPGIGHNEKLPTGPGGDVWLSE